jgi:hypothetical protein
VRPFDLDRLGSPKFIKSAIPVMTSPLPVWPQNRCCGGHDSNCPTASVHRTNLRQPLACLQRRFWFQLLAEVKELNPPAPETEPDTLEVELSVSRDPSLASEGSPPPLLAASTFPLHPHAPPRAT